MTSNKCSFTTIKNNITCNINIIKEKSETSIFIETDSYNNYYSYSQKIDERNILNTNKEEKIDLLFYFRNMKFLIREINSKEIIIEIKIESDNYTIEKDFKEFNFIKINHIDNNNVLYIKIKRNEYCVLWKNNEKKKYKDGSLTSLCNFCKDEVNMPIFCVNSIEEAIEFVKKRLNDKIIFITNIGQDYSGKRLIEIIRKIYGFNIIVLFYSYNTEHFSWIKDFPNCLYDENGEIFKEYLRKYNIEDLKKLRIKNMNIKEYKGLSLKEFTDDFLNYSKINKSIKIPNIQFKIYNEKKDIFLFMSEHGKIKYKNNNNEKQEDCIWKITFLDNTITFYSNGLYLKDNIGNVEGCTFMTVWNFAKLNDNNYYFLNPKKKANNILSIEDNELKVSKSEKGEHEIFQLIEVKENEEKLLDIGNSFFFNSFLSQKINDITDTRKMESSFNSSLLNVSFPYSNVNLDIKDNFSSDY